MWQFTAMPDRPATDPAKPGTNLDKQLALGRRGGIRFVTADPVEEPKLKPKPKLRKAKAVLAAVTEQQFKKDYVERAADDITALRERLEDMRKANEGMAAERDEAIRQSQAEKATSKVGRPSSGEPWKALGISERTYYRRQKAEQRNGPVG